MKQLVKAVSLSPDKIEPRLLVAQALLDDQKPRDAEKRLARAIERWPGNARAHLVMGYCLQEQGKTEQAAEEFQKVVSLTDDPTQKISAHLGLAAICEQQGQQDKADRHYAYALAIEPQLREVLIRIEGERLWPRSAASGSLDPTRPASVVDRQRRIEELLRDMRQED